MAGEWRDTILGDVIELKRGYDLPSRERKEGRFPIVSSSGISGYHVEAKVKAPGVVTGRYGTIGQVFYITTDFWPLNTALYVRDFKGNDPRFISYFLQTLNFLAYSDKAAVPGLNRNHLHSAPVRVPPLKQQQAIACILGALDDKIELNRTMNRTLEAMARAIFKSWFIDFDPVRAKAAGQKPAGLKPDIAALFPDSFEQTDQGEIPTSWRVSPIGDMVQVLGGGTPSTKEPAYWEGGTHPFCTPKDMSSLTEAVLLGTERHLTDAGLAKVSSGQLPVGTVLLSSRAPIGYLAIAETPVSVNQGIIAMVCDGELPNLYVLHWTRANMDRVLANANGSTFMEISKRNFRPIRAVVPSRQVLRCFMQMVEPMHQRIVSSLKQIQYLADLRDSLLPKLMSGELVVAEAERIVGRAV